MKDSGVEKKGQDRTGRKKKKRKRIIPTIQHKITSIKVQKKKGKVNKVTISVFHHTYQTEDYSVSAAEGSGGF